METLIYGLFDSGSPEALRYVGKAHAHRLPTRLREHMRDAARNGKSSRDSYKARWIRIVGMKRSAETCERIRASKIGRRAKAPKSPETRAKLSAAQVGRHRPYVAAQNAARVYTPELRARISAAQRLRYARAREVVALG
jgi:NUMOD3 motif